MSDPIKLTGKETLADAVEELMGATSSLHMYDDLVDEWVDGGRGECPFLDEKYVWAQHSMRHIQTGLRIVCALRETETKVREGEYFIDRMKNKIAAQEAELTELRAMVDGTMTCTNGMVVPKEGE